MLHNALSTAHGTVKVLQYIFVISKMKETVIDCTNNSKLRKIFMFVIIAYVILIIMIFHGVVYRNTTTIYAVNSSQSLIVNPNIDLNNLGNNYNFNKSIYGVDVRAVRNMLYEENVSKVGII